jgi:hypothetical protein
LEVIAQCSLRIWKSNLTRKKCILGVPQTHRHLQSR